MNNDVNFDRSRFLISTIGAFAVSQLTVTGIAYGQRRAGAVAQPRLNQDPDNRPFGAFKQIDTGGLNVGYAEAGHPSGPAVIGNKIGKRRINEIANKWMGTG